MKDPILEELRRIRRKHAEDKLRDPEGHKERMRQLLSKYWVQGEDGVWHAKPKDPPPDPITVALQEAEYLPRVARKIRRRKILARLSQKPVESEEERRS